MAGEKWSEWTDAGALAGTDALPIFRPGANLRTTLAAVLALLVDAAPGTLDTLNELAAALGDDPNFAATITAALAAKAADSAVVHNTGAETVAGVKTFSAAPVLPAGALPESAVANLTTDLAARALDAAVVHATGGETVAGVKTFSSSPIVPDPTTAQQAASRAYVLANAGVPDADAATKGKLQLAGDLGGTATAPTVPTKVSKVQTVTTGVDVPVFKIQPDVVARGPFGFTVGDSLFNTTRDFVGYFGYNAANGGGRYLGTEHSFAWVHESDYEVGAGTHWAESYTEYRNKTGTFSFRPWFIVIDKATDIIQQHSFYGTPFSWLTQAGVQVANLDSNGVFQTYSPAGVDPLLRINAAAGRNPQLAGYSGTVARFLIQGTADYQATLSVNGGMIACFQYVSGQHCLSIGSTDTVGSFYVKGPHAASNVMAAAQFSAAQTAPLLCLYNYDRSVVFGGFNRNGYLSVQKTTAPSDAELAASEMTLWLDATNGAAKLMVKAKQADGTVRTGSLALA